EPGGVGALAAGPVTQGAGPEPAGAVPDGAGGPLHPPVDLAGRVGAGPVRRALPDRVRGGRAGAAVGDGGRRLRGGAVDPDRAAAGGPGWPDHPTGGRDRARRWGDDPGLGGHQSRRSSVSASRNRRVTPSRRSRNSAKYCSRSPRRVRISAATWSSLWSKRSSTASRPASIACSTSAASRVRRSSMPQALEGGVTITMLWSSSPRSDAHTASHIVTADVTTPVTQL